MAKKTTEDSKPTAMPPAKVKKFTVKEAKTFSLGGKSVSLAAGEVVSTETHGMQGMVAMSLAGVSLVELPG